MRRRSSGLYSEFERKEEENASMALGIIQIWCKHDAGRTFGISMIEVMQRRCGDNQQKLAFFEGLTKSRRRSFQRAIVDHRHRAHIDQSF